MSTLMRGKARQRITNPRIQKLAQKNRKDNAQVMFNLSAKFAGAVNGVAEYQSRRIAEQALDATEAAIKDSLKNMVTLIQREYANSWNHSTYFGVNPTDQRAAATTSFSNNFGTSLSRKWIRQKRVRLREHGKTLPADNAAFHGFGHFGVPYPDNSSGLKVPLKEWASDLNLTDDVMNLYRLMGMARLQITGDLATYKDFKQTDKGFVDPKGRKTTLKAALKRTKPHQIEGQGLVIKVHKTQGLSAYAKGRRVSLLELNHAGLIGSKLQLVALSNMFRGAAIPKNRGYKFIEHAQQFAGGQHDIFGKSAGTKLGYSAKYRGRDPMGNLLELILDEVMPMHLHTQMKKRKLV